MGMDMRTYVFMCMYLHIHVSMRMCVGVCIHHVFSFVHNVHARIGAREEV